jgi:hypothetical protein
MDRFEVELVEHTIIYKGYSTLQAVTFSILVNQLIK